MFGINSQAASQNNGAVNSYAQELPVGGDDLLATGGQSSSIDPFSQLQYNPPDSGQAQQYSEPTNTASNDDLIDIKKDALQQLTPLVSHLDQSPEEKFRTTMMLIQATDDKSLLRSAYESASQIQDSKSRAQALLDVVNEINYFTHPNT
jgi:hypothetical protein